MMLFEYQQRDYFKLSPSHCFTQIRSLKPAILMLFSCILGIYLLLKASKSTALPFWQIAFLYIAGLLLLMPMLYVFFALYQILLIPVSSPMPEIQSPEI